MQKLDWKQAIRVIEQIRTLRPDVEGVRKNLIELNLRLNQTAQANAELENYLTYLQSGGHSVEGIKFIEGLLEERPGDLMLRRALAQQYQQAGRVEEAVTQLDSIADSFLNSGRKEEAIVTINQILLMNPPTADQYRQLLMQLQSS
jgi:thioredoxin-like negative regulator of GroEL